MFGLFNMPGAQDVLSAAHGFVSTPENQRRIQAITDVATRTVSALLPPPPEPSPSVFLPPLTVVPRQPKSIAFYQGFKTRTELPVNQEDVLRLLQSKPTVCKAIRINDYLKIISEFKTTSKIYTKLLSQWGYTQFYRILETDSKGLASAFIMHVLLEDSPLSPSLLHDRLVNYFHVVLQANKYPHLKTQLTTSLEAMHQGSKVLDGITLSGACVFMDTLSTILVQDFYEKTHLQDLNFERFVASLPTHKELLDAITLLEGAPTALLVPLLGPKQSIFGLNPMRKFQLFKDQLPQILQEVKMQLLAYLDDTAFKTYLETVDPIQLLIIFDSEPLAIAHKESVKPRMLELFKGQTKQFIIDCQSSFLEGFNFSQRATAGNLCAKIADELTLIPGAYLFQLHQIDASLLFKVAEAVENFEDELVQRQLDFAYYLANVFNINFNIHSWQISIEEKKRLKLHHIGHWHGPTCDLVLFPEGNKSRVDLLKPHGIYTARTDLSEITKAPSFKVFKRHGSTTLASMADNTTLPAQDRLLAKQFLYFRLHIFACLQKLLDKKLPLLTNANHYDTYGNKEDDSSQFNPFGSDEDYHNQTEAITFKFEKHLSGLNREIAELAYITDCVFSHHKHEDIIFEITKLLKRAKKITKDFYISKIPELLRNFQAIITACIEEASRIFISLKGGSEAYAAINRATLPLFEALISKPDLTTVLPSEILPLIPHLQVKINPPEVFRAIDKLKKMIDNYQEAMKIDVALLQRQIIDTFQEIKNDQEIFLSFYPHLKDSFTALTVATDPLTINSALISSLIPESRLQNALVEKIITSLNALSQKIAKYASTVTLQSETTQATIKDLRVAILKDKDSFIQVNPLKRAEFEHLLSNDNILTINSVDLLHLKTIPKSSTEDLPIYKQLTLLYKILTKARNYKKELTALEKKQGVLASRADEEFSDVMLDEDTNFPDAGSLGSCDDDTSSVGGASYSSEFQAMEKTPLEEWIDSLL